MQNLKSKIESLLFINNQPFTIKRLMELTGADKKSIEQSLTELTNFYNSSDRGINVQFLDGKVQMVTAGENAGLVKHFIKEETTGELSRAALETLTIIAYRCPISRAELEQIRGVNCAIILRNLMMRGLVDSVQDKQKMQTIYSVTLDFLRYLGVNHPSELPDYEKLNSHQNIEELLSLNVLSGDNSVS